MIVRIAREQPTFDSGIAVDGQVLRLKSIAKDQFDELEKMKSGTTIADAYKFAELILNTNTAGIVLPAAEVEKLDCATVSALIKGYTAYLHGFATDPN